MEMKPIPVQVKLTPEVKPGAQTTEYWTTLLTHGVTFIVLFMSVVLHKQFIDQQALNALIPTGALIGSGIAQVAYTLGRAKVKVAAHESISNQAIHVTQQIDPALSAELTQALSGLRAVGAQVEAFVRAPYVFGQPAPGGGSPTPLATQGEATTPI